MCTELGNVDYLRPGHSVLLSGYRVLGATLWTSIPRDPVVQSLAVGSMNDFNCIAELRDAKERVSLHSPICVSVGNRVGNM